MNEILQTIQNIRERQLKNGIRFLAVLGFFALLASILRGYKIGWNNIFYLHMAFYILILVMAVFDKILSFKTKAIALICVTYLAGVSGLLGWGLISFGLIFLFAFSVIATLLFGSRAGILSVILSIISITIIGAFVIKGVITYHFNAPDLLTSASTWLVIIIGIIIFVGITVVTLATMNKEVFELVENLDEKNDQLVEINKKLEQALSEGKRLEAGLEHAQKMKFLGTIAGGVAHDLNNVLSATISYPELILMDLPESSPLKEPVESILKSSKKAAAIVQDLLTLTRRGVPVEEVLNINHIIKECLTSPEFEKIMKYHPGVQVEINLEEYLYNVAGSSFHLSNTIINLISNAAEAISDRGKIIIETRNRFIDRTFQGFEEIKAGNYAVIIVSDTGSGIPEKEMNKIFEPFYSKKVMGKSGTGLGMTVVWNSVKDHKGFIDLESSEGEGSSFILYFPATTKPLGKPDNDSTVKEYTGKGESILIVDDIEEQRTISSNILSMLGYSVNTVSSGEAAVEYIKERPPDLIILDMIMSPGMDGLDTYKKIKTIRPRQKTIIVSGYSETSRIREAQDMGAGAYLRKPYTIEKLGTAVRAELDRND